MTSYGSLLPPRYRKLATVGTLLVLGGIAYSCSPQRPDKFWVSYGGDAASTRFFDSDLIDKSNVSELEVAWVYPQAEATFHPMMRRE